MSDPEDRARLAAMAAIVAKSRALVAQSASLAKASRRAITAQRCLCEPGMSDDATNVGTPDRDPP